MTNKTLIPASLLGGDIETILNRLREIPNLPAVLIDLAEKAYRLYRLNKLDHDLQDLRQTAANILRE